MLYTKAIMNKKILLVAIILVLIGIPLVGMLRQQLVLLPGSPPRDGAGSFMVAPTRSQDSMAVGIAEPVAEKVSLYGDMIPGQPGTNGFVVTADRSIVKSASLMLQVENPQTAVSSITQITTENQGLVTASNVYDYDFKNAGVQADLTLRVPTAKLEATLEAIKKVATKVVSESLTAQDKTEQRVDLEAQLRNLRATEDQLLAIMAKAQTVEQTLQVQQQLTTTRGQIERLDAQLQNLQGSVEMASITVNLSTEASSLPVIDEENTSVIGEIKLALRDGYHFYRELFIAGLKLLIVALPVLILAAIAAVMYRKMRRPKM